MIQFPSNFFWGSATSSYQVEGDNSNADWWAWEKACGKEQSSQACCHYDRYEADFDLIKGLNHNAHRLSIEWSRIEPQEGQFSDKEIQHYIDVILALRKRGIEPMVTLHHFTNPTWFSQSGGWENKRSASRFFKYCEVMTRALAKHVQYWNTINEPTVYASHSYIFGNWPPQTKSYWKTKAVYDQMLMVHIKAYRLMNKVYEELNLPKPSISIAHHMQAAIPCSPTLKNRFAVYLRDKLFNFGFIDKAVKAKALDFIGVNYYSRQQVDISSWWIGNLIMEVCNKNHDPVTKNALGWDIYPRGLYLVLKKLKKYDLPVVITENGICTADDQQRWEFIREHLKCIHQAMQEGVKVTGYLYWSLMDNFEWAHGFGPRFGLIDVDYKTQQRTIRESAKKFAKVCKSGVLEN